MLGNGHAMSKVPRLPCPGRRRLGTAVSSNPRPAGARLGWLVFALWAAAGCSKDPESKIRGWPPPAPVVSPAATDAAGGAGARGERSASAGAPRPSPAPGLEPRARPTGESDAQSAASAQADAEPLDVLADLEPCDALLVEACALLGPHSEECIEARASAPGDRTLTHTTACAEILTRWRPVAVGEARGNPCRLLAARKCEVLGEHTRGCLDARAVAARLRRPEHRRACGGDLLLWEARQVLSGR